MYIFKNEILYFSKLMIFQTFYIYGYFHFKKERYICCFFPSSYYLLVKHLCIQISAVMIVLCIVLLHHYRYHLMSCGTTNFTCIKRTLSKETTFSFWGLFIVSLQSISHAECVHAFLCMCFKRFFPLYGLLRW